MAVGVPDNTPPAESVKPLGKVPALTVKLMGRRCRNLRPWPDCKPRPPRPLATLAD